MNHLKSPASPLAQDATILICDDEPDIVSAVRIYLEREGYATLAAHDGEQALRLLSEHTVQLVLLDCMMPRMDGLTALCHIRELSNVPVILLTAKTEEADLVRALELGGDDYITKPFRPAELLARVRSQLRRYTTLGGEGEEDRDSLDSDAIYTVGSIRLDHRTRRVTLEGREIPLTPREYDIMFFLMRHPGEVFSPAQLYESVWQDRPLGAEGTVAVHIRHLREKLEIDPASPRWIKVVWGQGYKLESDRSPAADLPSRTKGGA